MKRALPFILAPFILMGCNDDNDNTIYFDGESAAVITTAVWGGSGTHAIINTEDYTQTINELAPTITDIEVITHGENIFRIERNDADNIARFHMSKPAQAEWQFSTLDDPANEVSGNPYDLVFINESKAVLLRYAKSTAWIVDPSANTQEDFKIGEIDLSAYNDSEGNPPEAHAGVVVGDKLFISMQKLDANWAPGQAYVAVFDTNTLVEIDTDPTSNGLLGIPLNIKNPNKVTYSAETGLIHVQGITWDKKDYATNEVLEEIYESGVTSINPNTYEMNLLINDQPNSETSPGKIYDIAIASATKGYIIGLSAVWGDNTLYSFNPTTGAINMTPVSQSLTEINMEHIEIGPNGLLWIGNKELNGITIIDPADDSIVKDLINTNLPPIGIDFITRSTAP